MSLLALSGTNSVSGGYDIDNSCKFEADNSEYMDRVITSQGNQKTFTISAWVKRTEVNSSVDGFGHTFFFGGAYGNEAVILRFNTGTTSNVDALQIGIGIGTTQNRSYTQRKFRDTSAWYHIVLAVDTTQATATDRFKLYVNGVLETEYASRNNPAQNLDTGNNKAQSATYLNNVGSYKSAGTVYGKFCGYIAEVYNIDGSALAPTDFGEFDSDSGIWKPIKYTGSFPNNSFYLDFEDSSDLGAQAKGDDRNFTLYNITAADQATDTPTNNFCTLNVIANIENNAVVFTEGATVGSVSGGGNVSDHAMATMGFSSGKWYYEAYVTTGSTNDDAMFGFANTNGWYQGLGNYTFSAGAHNVGRWYYNSNTFTTTGATAWDKGDIVQIAIDCDNGKCWSGVNGTYSSGDPSTNTGGFDWDANVTDMSIGDLVIPVTRVLYTAPGTTYYNFGGYTLIPISSAASDANGYGTFEYAPPTGFHAICTKNLAEYG